MKTNQTGRWILLCVAAALAPGCAAPDYAAADFGKSVRQMVDSQIYDPDAALNPPPDPPTETDGRYAEGYLKIYRGYVGDPVSIKKEIVVPGEED